MSDPTGGPESSDPTSGAAGDPWAPPPGAAGTGPSPWEARPPAPGPAAAPPPPAGASPHAPPGGSVDPAVTPLVGPPPSLGGAGAPPPPWAGSPQPYVAPTPPPRRRRWVPVAAVAAVAVLAGGFGIASVLDGEGADSPEEAVEALFAAVDDEDVIGALEALDPGERRVLRPMIEGIAEEARRLELASPDLDLGGVDGVDLVVEGLTFDTEPLTGDLVAVDLTGGTVTASADLQALPMGAVLREVVTDDGGDPEADRIDLDGVRLVARRSGGGWYVNAGYSVAEQARMALDPVPAVPDLGAAIAPGGADDPEAAVRQAIDAALATDVAALIDLASPSELPALHHYGPLLVAESADDDDGYYDDYDDDIEVVDLQLEVAGGPGSTAVVTARSFEIRQTSSWSGGSDVSTWTYDGSCLTIEWDGDEGWSSSEPVDWCGEDGIAAPALFLWGGGEVGAMSIVTVEEGGRWFISPTRSLTELVLGPFRSLDVDDARRTVRWWAGDWWVTEPDSFWEACGVDRPSLDASSADGEAAYGRCWDQLPDDYDGPGGWYGPGRFEQVGPAFEDDEWYDDDWESEWEQDWEPSPAEQAELDCYDNRDPAAVGECLADLVAAGIVDEDVLAYHRCGTIFDDLYESQDRPTEEDWEAADEAHAACLDDALGG